MCGRVRFHKLGITSLIPGLVLKVRNPDGSNPKKELELSRNRFARVENGIWKQYPNVLLPDIESIFEGLFEFHVGNTLCIIGVEHPEFYETANTKKVVSIMTIGTNGVLRDKQQQEWVDKVLNVHSRSPIVIRVNNREALLESISSC